MTEKIIETSRFYLRTFQESDFDQILVLLQDPEVMKHTGFRRVQSKEESKERLNKWCGDDRVWAAFESETDQLIGWFMLKVTTTEFPELGFMITKSFWGKGAATEISKNLIVFARTSLNVSKVIAKADVINLSSHNVLKKIGMNQCESKEDYVLFELHL
jgi:ribosomal-protein-alanine N-acetyltransferase